MARFTKESTDHLQLSPFSWECSRLAVYTAVAVKDETPKLTRSLIIYRLAPPFFILDFHPFPSYIFLLLTPTVFE